MASSLVEPRQLKKIRSQLGLTQGELAKMAGVSQSIIAKIEAGGVDPTFNTLWAISRALSTTTSKRGKRASDVMSSPVVGVQKEARIRECAEIMKRRGFSQLPVLSGKRVVGTITDSHIVTLLSGAPDPHRLLDESVGNHILPSFAIVGSETPVEALFSLFKYLSAVLVGSGEDVQGIITKIDLLATGS